MTAVERKIARLRSGRPLRVLDLFAGCGGFSLGFQAAGCEITAAVEFDVDAARSHGANFHPGDARHSIARDITTTPASALTASLGLGDASLAFDILIGGPPCQAFARVGRSKLREVAEHPEAFRHDPRARLYIEYMQYVADCMPLAVVIENVPDMLNHAGHNLADEIAEVLTAKGYNCRYTLLNAAFYGVPQMRERMFLIAIHKSLSTDISFPEPSHWIDLPPGYEGARSVALKLLNGMQLFRPNPWYIQPPVATPDLPPAITTRQAIEDLPAIDARAQLRNGTLRRGARRFDQAVSYAAASVTAYGTMMREWPGFTGTTELKDHVIRYLPRDYALFARLAPGDQYPQAVKKAEEMFRERLELLKAQGNAPATGSAAWKKLRASIVPPYDPGKFPNKWRKMEADAPSRTLLAHLGKDGYSHIHYDSAQARTISVREAARLQSFPDGFVFSGTMNPAFKQIGNAVPPLLAKAVARSVQAQIIAGIMQPPFRLAGGQR